MNTLFKIAIIFLVAAYVIGCKNVEWKGKTYRREGLYYVHHEKYWDEIKP